MGDSGLLERQARSWDLDLTEEMQERLMDYARLLTSYEKANVIGTRDLERVVSDHVLDSLSCLLVSSLGCANRVADVGSGGGLPGIPIKVAAPDVSLTLIESTAKKSAFLSYAVESLSLDGVAIENARVEEIARDPHHRGGYDATTVRAVARLAVVAEYCVPLLRVGGVAVAMKARLQDEEISEGERAAEMLGARISERIRVPLIPEVGEKERQLVVIEKVRETAKGYPRKPGVAARRPLGSG